MGHLLVNNNIFDKFFKFLFDLDTASKKRLIIKLTESINDPENQNDNFYSLFGKWEDSKDADTIIREIRDSRIEKDNSNLFR
jgi:hypothetical protein